MSQPILPEDAEKLAEEVIQTLTKAADQGNLWAVAWNVRLKMAFMFSVHDKTRLIEELEEFRDSLSSMWDALAPVIAYVQEMFPHELDPWDGPIERSGELDD